MFSGGLLAAFSLLFWLGATDLFGKLILGSVFLGGGGVLTIQGLGRYLRDRYAYDRALVQAFPRPSDPAVEHWLNDGTQRVRKHSLEKLSLMEEDCDFADLPPIRGPIMWLKSGLDPEHIIWTAGTDGVARFGTYSITYLWFAEHYLAIFRCDYDLIKDAILNEETYEYFYQDIISFSTHEEASALTLKTGQSLTSRQEFRIAVANGSYFSVTVGASQLKRLTGAERVPDSGAEKAISAIRKKLQEKKHSMLGS